MIRKKVCMLGAYAVGKTSLVRRFVENTFSDRYQTTIGVKVVKKRIEIQNCEITLMLWDLHGDDDFQTVQTSYLRGASGYLLVADGTRAETLNRAVKLKERATRALGDVPFLLIANKHDLGGDWELEDGFERRLPDWTVVKTSAKSGSRTEEAFQEITTRMLRVQ